MKISDFEETFSAWLDGALTADEAATFEKTMIERGFDPAAERGEARQLGTLLRRHAAAPPLDHADFFNHQLLHRIESETAREQPPRKAAPAWWTLPRFAWAGAFCLLLATVLYQAMIPGGRPAPIDGSPYFAKVLDARPLAPDVSADTVYTERDNVTVVWLGGLDYLPADYQIN